MDSYQAIFQKAMVSVKPEAIIEVARAFEALSVDDKAWYLYQRGNLLRHHYGFGAMARGTAIKGTNGAVIPPGRYWQDIIGDTKKKVWADWIKGKSEVEVESTEDHADENRLFVIFIIPPTANNYGLPGLFFPTNVLGFPTIAGAVQSSQDTVQRPPEPTSTEVLSDITEAIGKALGSAGKGVGEGLGLSTTKLALIGGAALVTLFLLNRIMIPIPHIP